MRKKVMLVRRSTVLFKSLMRPASEAGKLFCNSQFMGLTTVPHVLQPSTNKLYYINPYVVHMDRNLIPWLVVTYSVWQRPNRSQRSGVWFFCPKTVSKLTPLNTEKLR